MPSRKTKGTASAPDPTPDVGAQERKEQPHVLPIGDAVRRQTFDLLLRAVKTKMGEEAACESKCEQIEVALFDFLQTDHKEYRRRARSLLFNLRAADMSLLGRVMSGEVSPTDLVRLDPEELASEDLKARRKLEREMYFRTEVNDVEGSMQARRDVHLRAVGKREEDGDELDDTSSEPMIISVKGKVSRRRSPSFRMSWSHLAAASWSPGSSESNQSDAEGGSSPTESESERAVATAPDGTAETRPPCGPVFSDIEISDDDEPAAPQVPLGLPNSGEVLVIESSSSENDAVVVSVTHAAPVTPEAVGAPAPVRMKRRTRPPTASQSSRPDAAPPPIAPLDPPKLKGRTHPRPRRKARTEVSDRAS